MISILIIDDSPEDREKFFGLLKDADPSIDIKTCHGGDDGVATAKQIWFDCVLLDLRLDGEDGLEVLARLQAVRPDLPIIVFTGQGSEQTAAEAFVAGAAYYLPKDDLTARTLWTAIERVMKRAETERELKSKRDAMERSSRLDSVGQLAAGIAHDFNNQLASLRFSIDLLRGEITTEKSETYIAAAQNAVEHCAQLTTRLVSFSSQGAVQAKPVRVGDSFADLRALASASIVDKVILEIAEPEEDLAVVCDPGQLLNALLNLVLNSVDAIREKQTSGRIKVTAVADADKLRLTVADDGAGMSQDVLARCTDPFFTTKEARSGTGLGLAMVQGFATENSGELLFQSKPDTGTEVTLVLPASEQQREPAKTDQAADARLAAGWKILLVEDQLALGMVTKEILEGAGCVVDLVLDGNDALELLSANPAPDLLLTDIRLPGMNGFELADEARRRNADLPIIYLTGYSDSPEALGQAHGPILKKPLARDDLIAALNTALVRKQA